MQMCKTQYFKPLNLKYLMVFYHLFIQTYKIFFNFSSTNSLFTIYIRNDLIPKI